MSSPLATVPETACSRLVWGSAAPMGDLPDPLRPLLLTPLGAPLRLARPGAPAVLGMVEPPLLWSWASPEAARQPGGCAAASEGASSDSRAATCNQSNQDDLLTMLLLCRLRCE